MGLQRNYFWLKMRSFSLAALENWFSLPLLVCNLYQQSRNIGSKIACYTCLCVRVEKKIQLLINQKSNHPKRQHNNGL